MGVLPCRRLALVLQLAVIAGNALLAGVLLANDLPTRCRAQLRPQDQLWLVSDRALGCPSEEAAGRLQYWRYDAEKSWGVASLAELEAADRDDLNTTIFVHGNRVDWNEAFTTGWSVYRAMTRSDGESPLRLIIWSWPSSQIKGIRQDALVKAARTNVSAYYLAWFANRLETRKSLGLWGYSFGARVITGALHLLAGGELAGQRLAASRPPAPREPANVVLMAAALDNTWLARGRFHGLAASQMGRLLLVNNSCDTVLKYYHLMYHRRACQEALGYTGLSMAWLAAGASTEVRQIDACCQVGSEHRFANYLCAGGIMTRIRDLLIGTRVQDKAATKAAVATTE